MQNHGEINHPLPITTPLATQCPFVHSNPLSLSIPHCHHHCLRKAISRRSPFILFAGLVSRLWLVSTTDRLSSPRPWEGPQPALCSCLVEALRRAAPSAALVFGRGHKTGRRPTKASAVGGRQQACGMFPQCITKRKEDPVLIPAEPSQLSVPSQNNNLLNPFLLVFFGIYFVNRILLGY